MHAHAQYFRGKEVGKECRYPALYPIGGNDLVI